MKNHNIKRVKKQLCKYMVILVALIFCYMSFGSYSIFSPNNDGGRSPVTYAADSSSSIDESSEESKDNKEDDPENDDQRADIEESGSDPADTVTGDAEQDDDSLEKIDKIDADEKEDPGVKKEKLKAARAVQTVWFDGTLGLGTANSLVRGATNVRVQTDAGGGVTLPNSAGNSTKYKLNGWYDIKSKKWYAPGETVNVSEDTVFYADWILRNYDLQQNGTLASGQADTSSFVRTDVFDYNELFNITHGANVNGSVNYNGHTETWRDSGGDSFLFMNWYNQNISGYGTLGAPNNLTSGRNALNSGNQNGYGITSGIISSQNDQLLKDLFDTESTAGKTYLGNGDNLFLYDDSGKTQSRGFGEGYYYYDSDYNGADYNKDEQRFYVYDQAQYIQGQSRGWNGNWTNGERKPGFMPFEQGTVNEKTGQTDYWFGMKTSIDFFLPDDVGSNNGNCNKSVAGKDMRFYFSGDDDVWVFVDGVKVLDLGGIHRRSAGDINYSTGEIRYYRVNDNGTETLASVDTTTLKNIKSGDHKLEIYYLERGSSWSNCSIYFNLAPRYELKIVKSDADDESILLPNAEFSIYKDSACTVPAMLYDDPSYSGTAKNVFRTNEHGIIECYGMTANQTYYIKETDSPPAYPAAADKVITLKIDSSGNAVLADTDPLFASVSQNGSTRIDMKVRNKKPEKTSVGAEKRWYGNDGSVLTENIPDKVTVHLYRSETDTATPGGGGNSGADIPVRITTQYFGAGNGSNTENSALSEGDLSENFVVTQGGDVSLDLDIIKNTQEDKYEAGIYSVTVNGQYITPYDSYGKADQECFIGGRWGQYPPIHTKYKIENITRDTEIKVILIGYLNYKDSTPLVSETLSMQTSVTNLPEQGSQTPQIKPDDAVEVEGISPVELSSGNDWKHIWKDLPATSEDGTKTYYYYVEEDPVTGFTTSYSGNGTAGGNVIISNVKTRLISVKKVWQDAGGSQMQSGMPDSIDARLIQTDITTGAEKQIDFTLQSENGWTKRWRSDSSELGEINGHSYTYKVREVSSFEEFEVTYGNNEGISEGEITIKNKKVMQQLPSAGGSGTHMYYFIGALLAALGITLMAAFRKHKKTAVKSFLAAVLICVISQSSFAAAGSMSVPVAGTGNMPDDLSIVAEYIYNGSIPIQGAKVCICKVADLDVKNGKVRYVYTNDFSDEGDFPEKLTASQSAALAKRLYKKITSENIRTICDSADNEGKIVFSGLSPGIYLVSQTSDTEISGGIYRSDPFLAAVPQLVEDEKTGAGRWLYGVSVKPKTENVKFSDKTGSYKGSAIKDGDKYKGPVSHVKTNDPFNFRLFGIIMIASALVLIVMFILRKKKGS